MLAHDKESLQWPVCGYKTYLQAGSCCGVLGRDEPVGGAGASNAAPGTDPILSGVPHITPVSFSLFGTESDKIIKQMQHQCFS